MCIIHMYYKQSFSYKYNHSQLFLDALYIYFLC